MKINYTYTDITADLLRAAIAKQIYSCVIKDRYRAGIYVASDKSEIVFDMVGNILKDFGINQENGISKSRRSLHGGRWFEFKNGSSLKILFASQTVRGNKFNDIIIDSNIEEELKHCVYRQTWIPYLKNTDAFEYDNDDLDTRLMTIDIPILIANK